MRDTRSADKRLARQRHERALNDALAMWNQLARCRELERPNILTGNSMVAHRGQQKEVASYRKFSALTLGQWYPVSSSGMPSNGREFLACARFGYSARGESRISSSAVNSRGIKVGLQNLGAFDTLLCDTIYPTDILRIIC